MFPKYKLCIFQIWALVRATMSLVFLKYKNCGHSYNTYIVYFPHTAQCIFQIWALVGGSTRLEGPLQPLLYCWLLKYCDVCIDDRFCSDLSCFCAMNNWYYGKKICTSLTNRITWNWLHALCTKAKHEERLLVLEIVLVVVLVY